MGLLAHSHALAATLSGGQARRLAVACECFRPVPVLLLDEPTSGQDATTTLEIVRLLRDFASGDLGGAPKVVVLTVHQPRREVWESFDHVAILGVSGGVGMLVHAGTPAQLSRQVSARQRVDNRAAAHGLPAKPIMEGTTKSTNAADLVLDAVAAMTAAEVLKAAASQRASTVQVPTVQASAEPQLGKAPGRLHAHDTPLWHRLVAVYYREVWSRSRRLVVLGPIHP